MFGINSASSLNHKPFQHIAQAASRSGAPSTSAGTSAMQAVASSGNAGSTTTNFRDQLASAINKIGSLPSKRSAAGHGKGHRSARGKKGFHASRLGIG
jgi:hypothetical protein